MRRSITSAIACLLMCCAVSACDDATIAGVTTGPSTFANRLEFVGIEPAVVVVGSLHTCPSVTPLSVPFTVNVTAAASPIVLSEVRVHTIDPFRRTSPPTIFDSSSLTRRFGSVTVAGFTTRGFGFTHPLGCAVDGTFLHVSVKTTDRGGVGHMSDMQVPVR
jgi:hypothetical protein